MSFDEPLDDTDQPDGTTSIRLGRAVLMPMDEKDHYGLFRPLLTVKRDGPNIQRDVMHDKVGPLAIYRRRRGGDKIPSNVGSLPGMMRTGDDKQQFEVILVWRPDTGSTET